MFKCWFMPDIELLTADAWRQLRQVRLVALQDSPDAFLATFERESRYTPAQWRAEFGRGDWHIGIVRRRPISLLGVTREAHAPMDECYLEYLWVAADWRGSGFAYDMVTQVLKDLQESGVRVAYLWVLDGNATAMRLYERLGFSSTSTRQPIAERPGRFEERLVKKLG
jgi:ribosomal protein S18 acetylase RimI-like enzyme